jgi:hypothetical protein
MRPYSLLLPFLLVHAVANAAEQTALADGCYRCDVGGSAFYGFVHERRLIYEDDLGRITFACALLADGERMTCLQFGEPSAEYLMPLGKGFRLVNEDGSEQRFEPCSNPPEAVGIDSYALPATSPDAGTCAKVAAEIVQRFEREQKARQQFLTASGGKIDAATVAKEEVAAALNEMMRLDEENSAWLLEVVRRDGPIRLRTHGAKAIDAMLLISLHTVQHLRMSMSILAGLREDFAQHLVSEQAVAALADRIALLTAKPMEYGIQVAARADGTPILPVIADIATLDKNRARIGQPPIAAASRQMPIQVIYLDESGRKVEPAGAAGSGLATLDLAKACRDPVEGLRMAGELDSALKAALEASARNDWQQLTEWTRSAQKWQRDTIGRIVMAIPAMDKGHDPESAVCAQRALFDAIINGLPANDDLGTVLKNLLAYSLVARAQAPTAAELQRADELMPALDTAIARPELRASQTGQAIIDTIACVRFRQARHEEAAALWQELLQSGPKDQDAKLYQQRLSAAQAKAAPGTLPR